MATGVILYGPPGSGKNTITNALHQLRSDCFAFSRIKVGGEPKAEYRMMGADEYSALDVRGEILWSNQRYGATYAIDKPALFDALHRGVPIIHLGQAEAVRILTALLPINWVTIELWCDRDTAKRRLENRGTRDLADRLAAWDVTERLDQADIQIDTRVTPSLAAANLIVDRLRDGVPPVPPVPVSR